MLQMRIQDVELASARFIEEHRWLANSTSVEHSEQQSAEGFFCKAIKCFLGKLIRNFKIVFTSLECVKCDFIRSTGAQDYPWNRFSFDVLQMSFFVFSRRCGASRNQLGFVCDCVNKHRCFTSTGAEEAVKQRQCRLIEFILIHEAHSSSVTERYESPLLICLSWKQGG